MDATEENGKRCNFKSESCSCTFTKIRNPVIRELRIPNPLLLGTRRSWESMRSRCLDEKNHRYYDYGGRGILICIEWSVSLNSLIRDIGYRPMGKTIDRRDNSLGYCKHNCRWATLEEQSLNRRISSLNKSGVVGVRFVPRVNKFTAYIVVSKKMHYLGYFETIEEATKVRILAEIMRSEGTFIPRPKYAQGTEYAPS